jgi:hypothetical protein
VEEKKEFWAMIELFGHQRMAGYLTEETIGGSSFIRVDVPQVEGSQAFTKYYGQDAIYSITPISEELAKVLIKRMQPAPLNIYIPEIKELSEESPFEDEI